MRLAIGLLVLLLSAHRASALTDTERQIIIERAKSGEIAGGAYRIEIKPEYAPDLKKRSLFVESTGGRAFINRDLDPAWQDCMSTAGATWMVNLLAGYTPAGPLVSSTIDLTDLPKVGDCNKDWHQALYQAAVDIRFDALSADVKVGDQLVRDYVDLIFGSVSVDVVQLEKDGKVIKADIKDMKGGLKTLQGELTQLAGDHNKLSQLIIDENRKKAETVRVVAQHERIAAGVSTVQLLGRVILRNSPDAQYKLTTGAKSIGAIADAVVDLSRSGVTDAAKILLSGNIANAALSIVGLFGPGGQDPTIALLQSGFSSVRADIHQLQAEMNDRFDRVDRALDTIYSSMQTRFDEITDRLDEFNRRLNILSVRQRQEYYVSISAFQALLTHEYKSKIQSCRNKEAPSYLTYYDFAQCLTAISLYGTDDAANDVFTGAVFFDPALQPEQAADGLDTLDPDYLRGFLAASLKGKGSLVGEPGSSAIQVAIPSPMGWSGAVDTYLAVRAIAPRLKSANDIKLAPLTSDSLKRLQNTGNRLFGGVVALRKYGAPLAMDIYMRDVRAAAKPLAAAIVAHLADSALGVVEVGDYRKWDPTYFNNGNDIDFELYRGAAQYVVVGPDKGNLVAKVSVQHRHVVSGYQATAGNVAWLKQRMDDALHDDANFGLGTYEPPVVTPADEVKTAVKRANATYLGKVKMTEWPAQATSALKASFTDYAGTDELRGACSKMAESKRYLDALATLYRSRIDLAKGWPAELQGLPTGTAIDKICGDLAKAISEAGPIEPRDGLAVDVLTDVIGERISARVVKLRQQYAAAPMDDSKLPEIELRLQRIQRCLKHADNPMCP
ncbi:hypothetical protein ACQR06_05445 [Bradyrhizobium sp. HKCCYLRH1065]|uniref:hypothetical protein n=1 Tax=Bradyrhizobium sp. HKCCYLRH1065 TaxID=3420753 RepID=UPI003EB6E886